MLVALVFVLARNIVKLVVERRRGLPFARFRAKLVALLLGMTLVPTIIVLMVGSELIRTNIDRWFNSPMEEILDSAKQIAGDYYQERQTLVSDHAARMARRLADVDLTNPDVAPIRDLLAPEVTTVRVQLVEVYRVTPGGRSVARRRAGRRRGRAGVAARIQRRRRRSPRGAGAERLARDALDRNPAERRRSAPRGGGHPRSRSPARRGSSSPPTI